MTVLQPGVSVVLIFFNEERFLGEAIDSVVAQTYPDFELLLCDDGSADGSAELARRAASDDPRIRLLTHPGNANRGAAATRNLGLTAARADRVAFLDADDVWSHHKLAEQMALLDAHPDADMVCGTPLYWRGWTGAPLDVARDRVVPVGAPRDRVTAPPDLLGLLYPFGPGYAPCPSDLLLRRAAADAVGGFEEHFHGEAQLYEDQAFLTKLYLEVGVYVSSRTWTWYREHRDSCVASVSAAGRYDAVRQRFLAWFEIHLERHGITDPAAWSALAAAHRAYRWPARARRSTIDLARRGTPATVRRLARTMIGPHPRDTR